AVDFKSTAYAIPPRGRGASPLPPCGRMEKAGYSTRASRQGAAASATIARSSASSRSAATRRRTISRSRSSFASEGRGESPRRWTATRNAREQMRMQGASSVGGGKLRDQPRTLISNNSDRANERDVGPPRGGAQSADLAFGSV